MRYEKVTTTAELPSGEKRKVTLEGKTLLIACVDGEYYAVNNRCPHMGGSLFDGEITGSIVACPRHGTTFDLKTGRVQQNGRIAMFRLKVADVETYPVKVENGDVLVGLD